MTLLLCKGANDDATARASARKGIIPLIYEASEDDLPKITAADEIVVFLARAFEDGWKDAASVFDLLEDTKKLQVRVVALCAAMRTLPLTDCALARLCHRL